MNKRRIVRLIGTMLSTFLLVLVMVSCVLLGGSDSWIDWKYRGTSGDCKLFVLSENREKGDWSIVVNYSWGEGPAQDELRLYLAHAIGISWQVDRLISEFEIYDSENELMLSFSCEDNMDCMNMCGLSRAEGDEPAPVELFSGDIPKDCYAAVGQYDPVGFPDFKYGTDEEVAGTCVLHDDAESAEVWEGDFYAIATLADGRWERLDYSVRWCPDGCPDGIDCGVATAGIKKNRMIPVLLELF